MEYKIDDLKNIARLLSGLGSVDIPESIKIDEIALYECCYDMGWETSILDDNNFSVEILGAILCQLADEDNLVEFVDYYFNKYGVDTRAVRFPGIISNVTPPGGGTTDYAVDIYYSAVKGEKFVCPIKQGTLMDMMYMPDALNAAITLMEADPARLIHRNAFNIASMSFDPETIYQAIKKHVPQFEMIYDIDPLKQRIADSWPDSLDDTCAREEWGWKPAYNLESMTVDMLEKLREKLK